jgi:hypothetical protein
MLLTVREAKAILGVSDGRTLAKLVPVLKFGHRTARVRLADVMQAVRTGRPVRETHDG